MREAGDATTAIARRDRRLGSGAKLGLLACLALLASVQCAATEGGSAERTTSGTTVLGGLPVDLAGTWLMVGNGRFVLSAQPTTDRFRTTVEIWAVERDPNGLTMSLVDQPLPAGIQTALDTANRELRAWTPSPHDVAEIRRSLGRLPRNDPDRFLRHTYRLADAAHAADLPGLPPDLAAGAKLGLEVEHEYRPQEIDAEKPAAQLMRDQAAYAASDVGTELAGQHVRTVLAAGFVPIPITTRGPFHLYRLRAPGDAEAEDAPGLGSRLATALRDLFRGCR